MIFLCRMCTACRPPTSTSRKPWRSRFSLCDWEVRVQRVRDTHSIYIYICINVYVYTYVYACVYIYVCIYIYACIYIYIHIHLNMYVYQWMPRKSLCLVDYKICFTYGPSRLFEFVRKTQEPRQSVQTRSHWNRKPLETLVETYIFVSMSFCLPILPVCFQTFAHDVLTFLRWWMPGS